MCVYSYKFSIKSRKLDLTNDTIIVVLRNKHRLPGKGTTSSPTEIVTVKKKN